MQRHFKRLFAAVAALALSGAAYAEVPTNLTDAQVAELGGAELINAAQEEGAVVVYTALTQSLIDHMAEKFQEQFPAITVEVVRRSGGQLAEMIAAEAQANQLRADVIEQSSWALMVDLQEKYKVLTPYTSPSDPMYTPLVPEFHGLMATPRTQLHAMAYNTALVPPEQAPKTWDDLLNPQFDGRRSVVTATGGGCAEAIWYMLDQTKGRGFFEKVAAGKPVISDANGLMIQMVSRGETLVTTMLDAVANEQIGQGAPVALVYPEEGVAACSHASGIAAGAQHPNAARIWYNWILSELGQGVWVNDLQGYSGRKGMALPEALSNIKIIEPDLAWLVQNRDQFVADWAKLFNYTP